MVDSATDNSVPRKRVPLKENTKKWSGVVLSSGFTWIPNVLLLKQRELGLDAVDMNILLQLICHWWRADKPPYVGKRALASRIGIDPSTVQRHIRKMESNGLLKRKARTGASRGRQTNAYVLKPLIDKLHPLAVALKKEKAQKAISNQSDY